MEGEYRCTNLADYPFGNLAHALSAVSEHAGACGYTSTFQWHVANDGYSILGRFSRDCAHIRARFANHARLSNDFVDGLRRLMRLPEDQSFERYEPEIEIVFPLAGPTGGRVGFVDLG